MATASGGIDSPSVHHPNVGFLVRLTSNDGFPTLGCFIFIRSFVLLPYLLPLFALCLGWLRFRWYWRGIVHIFSLREILNFFTDCYSHDFAHNPAHQCQACSRNGSVNRHSAFFVQSTFSRPHV